MSVSSVLSAASLTVACIVHGPKLYDYAFGQQAENISSFPRARESMEEPSVHDDELFDVGVEPTDKLESGDTVVDTESCDKALVFMSATAGGTVLRISCKHCRFRSC